jgi:hypothetical protein
MIPITRLRPSSIGPCYIIRLLFAIKKVAGGNIEKLEKSKICVREFRQPREGTLRQPPTPLNEAPAQWDAHDHHKRGAEGIRGPFLFVPSFVPTTKPY